MVTTIYILHIALHYTTLHTTLHTTMAECTKTTFVMRLLEHDWEVKKTEERETAEVGEGGMEGEV